MQPLEGIRVVDVSRALAGPFCTMLLGDLGADVIKVEQPGRGDETRSWGPPFKNGESAYFLGCNRNKRGITLNLKSDGGRDAFWRLLDRADVLVENFRPGLMARLGFGYEVVAERNPRLVYCSISGFGQDGPESTRPGYDIILQGMSGVTSLTGAPEGEPMRTALPVSDILTGMFASQSILAALLARQSTGRGQRVETTMLGATVAALANYTQYYLLSGELPPRPGNSHPQIAPYDLLRAADGYLNVAAGNDALFRALCAALDLAALADDERFTTNGDRVRNRHALLALIEERTIRMPVDDVLARLDAAGVPAGPIRDLGQVFASPQAAHLNLARTMHHPTVGDVRIVDTPLHLSETPATLRLPPPTLGQHTDEVLRELGYDEERIQRLHMEGAV